MRFEAFVPLRGGSKEIPRKNLKYFCGRPLFYWVISELLESDQVSRVVVSTDDKKIRQSVVDHFISHWRFDRLFLHSRSVQSAGDKTHWEMALLEYLIQYGRDLHNDDVMVMAQVTSPFTTRWDVNHAIDQYIKHCVENLSESLVSCVKTHRFVWLKSGHPFSYNELSRPMRQQFEGTLIENGALCINSIGNLRAHKARLTIPCSIYEMPEYSYIEIDSQDDWEMAEVLFRKHVLTKDCGIDD